MANRYVRVKSQAGQVYYGVLLLDRSVQVLDAPPWLGGQEADLLLEANDYQLLAPCAPSKIVAVGKNYAKHAVEMGGEVPPEPLIFLKPSTTVIAPGAFIQYPMQSQRVDYEGELALVIGDRCTRITPEVAAKKIWGYTIANDVTARDLQKSDRTWARAKGFDTFCPLGPWIVRDLMSGGLLQTYLNDETTPRQSDSIEQMVFPPEALVAFISQVMTLLPGDVVLTGTPQGIGPVKVGDCIRIKIEGIGELENAVAACDEMPN